MTASPERFSRPIRVLHLFSNSKWTGPAEPALNLCVALRACGVEADFACAPGSGRYANKVVETARDRGVEPVLRFRLSKHRHPIRNAFDRLALSRFLREGGYDAVHCHLDNDHGLALGAAARLGLPLIRSSYEGEGFQRTRRHIRLLSSTARLLEPSAQAMEHDAEAFGYPREKMRVVPGAVDVERFDPARETPDGRRWLKIPQDAFVIGIVARLQTHRQYETLFRAVRKVADQHPGVHLIVVGRGSKQTQVGHEPVAEMDLGERVHFAGFIEGENYVGMLCAFDVGVYLVPGSDGTCRAVREILAMGRPMVVADRGMLPEIVRHGEDGLVFDGSSEDLSASLLGLARDKGRLRAMGQKAREHACARFSLSVQAAMVLDVYEELLSAGR